MLAYTNNALWNNKDTFPTDIGNVLQKSKRLYFIENKGQWHEDVLFLCRMGGLDAWITKYGVNYSFYKIEHKQRPEGEESQAFRSKFEHGFEHEKFLGHRVLFELQGRNLSPKPEGRQKLEGYHNYFIGNDPSKHVSFVGLYGEVWVKNVYDGIDMRYYFEEGYLRFDFVVNPGADASKIRFKLKGADDVYLKSGKKLAFTTRFGEVMMADLRTFQEGKEVKSRFEKKGDAWQVALGHYNVHKPLVIDPLIYSTFLGGAAGFDRTDIGRAINTDINNNAYVAGVTNTSNYDVSSGAYQTTKNGPWDIFYTKLNVDASNLLYSTYFGGSSAEDCGGLFVNKINGKVYISGATSSTNMPVTSGTFQHTLTTSYSNDAFVVHFDSNGGLSNSTYIGGTNDDRSTGLYVLNGEVYVLGVTNSTDFDVTPSVIQGTLKGMYDIFVSKFNPTLGQLVYSTYFGGSNDDFGHNIAVNQNGEAMFVGKTSSSNYSISANSFNNNFGSGTLQAISTLLNQNGTSFIFSTFLGGSGSDVANDVFVDQNNNFYITGKTSSTDFSPMQSVVGMQTGYGGGASDAFFLKINSNHSLGFARYLGFNGEDEGTGISVDNVGNIYITGFTTSSNFTITPGAIQSVKTTTFSYEYDVFLVKVNTSANNILYSTYLGGTYDDKCYDLHIDNSNNIYLTGETNSNDFDITPGVFQTIKTMSLATNDIEVFVTKLCPEPIPTFSLTSSNATKNQTLCVNGSITPVTFSAVNSSTATFAGLPPGVIGSYNSGSITIVGSPTVQGNYIYTINVVGASCSGSLTTGTLNVVPSPQAGTINASGNSSQSVCVNQSIVPINFTMSGVSSLSVAGLPNGVNYSYTLNVTTSQILIAGTPTQSGTYVYSLHLSGVQCNTIYTGSIIVAPPISHTLLSAPASTNQNVCEGSAIQPITYLSPGVSAVTFSGLPNGVNGSNSQGSISISGTPSVSGFYPYSIILLGACGASTLNGLLNVLPLPTPTITSGSLFQNVCWGSGIQSISLSVSPMSTINVNGLPTGLTFNSTTNGGIISGTPSAQSPSVNVFTISVQNTCGVTQQTGTIVINSGNATAIQISPSGTESQTVCAGENISAISYSVGGVSSLSVTGIPPGTGYTLMPGVVQIEGTPLISGFYNYQLTVYGCGSNMAVKNGTIHVLPTFNMTLMSHPSTSHQTVCMGKSIDEIEYKITGNAVNTVQVVGLPSGVEYDFDFNKQEIDIEGTPNVGGIFIYTVTTPGACLENRRGVMRVDECTKLNVPNGFSGNGVWYIENIEQYPDNEVFIFGRWGNKIAHIKGDNNKDKAWGSVQYPVNVPEGTYYYVISIKDRKLKGYVELLK